MAYGPNLSTAFTLLDVLHPNQFEGESFTQNLVEQTEKNFYRGAPPIWLNFHISEQAPPDGTGIPLIKRDAYETLVQQIQQRSKRPGIPTVKLFHQPGCGGTTLAMQVLWDLRETFRCATLTGPTSDSIPYMLVQLLAREVVQLFTKDSSQKTVLLLLHDEQILENLQERIMEEIAAQKIVPRTPVVVLLFCLRKDADRQSDVVLKKALSDTEKQKFSDKKKELSKKYPDQYEQFHAFNIMQTNFSQAYVNQACTVFSNIQRANKPPKTQLTAFLALLNAYVPGSYLLESQCLEFLKQKPSPYDNISLEDIIKPFSHLIVIFTQNTSKEKRVHMAHPMIAQTCTELMAQAGVTRSDTTRNFLTLFCRAEVFPCLLGFIKNMLTKRETRRDENKEKQERFSKLILDIQQNEGEERDVNVVSVLKVASKRFGNNPFFSQVLARFYYIVIKNYNLAEMWAKRAKMIDANNSFIADTLGQVYKNHLKSKTSKMKNNHIPAKPRAILQLARRAIEAFKDEEELAENEFGTEMREDGNINVTHFHNTHGQFGYLQVCDILYDFLVSHNETWREVLRGNVPLGAVLDLLGDNKLFRYYDLIKSLRDDVKDKCDFLNAYLTYSKPGIHKENPSYCENTVESCYSSYVEGHPVPDLVMEIKNKFKSYMEDNKSFRDADTPESYIAAILKEWPTDNRNISSNLMQLIKKAGHSYDFTYAKYFRSRHLCPLFYLGKDEALGKFVPADIERFLLENEDAAADLNHMINKDQIFRDLRVQQNLLKCHGKVENYGIKASIGGTGIMLKANMQDSTWKQREVSFYVGFTIRGPVAFGIQTKPHENGSSRTCDSCHGVKDTLGYTAVTPIPITTNGVTIYSLQSEVGRFQCTVSGLRWACKKKISFGYQFRSWDQQNLNMVHCTPGGPLLEIRVTNGKFDEVYLPHWICVDGFPTVSDKFAVLHRKNFVNFLEQVSDVTSSHVKLFQPDFNTNGVLVRAGFPVKAHCNVLICQSNETFLTLHVHLIPCDPALQQALEQKERDRGSRIIRIMNTEKSLPMLDYFSLTSDAQTAEISPAQIQLSHEGRTPFTVVIKNAKRDFVLTVQHDGECMWSCTITKDNYRK